MKFLIKLILFLNILLLMFPAHAVNQLVVVIKNQNAKNIYHAMTGTLVDNQGAVGHLYRSGKSIVCQYINAEVDDEKGRPIPPQDPRRYVCTIKFDNNGWAIPVSTKL